MSASLASTHSLVGLLGETRSAIVELLHRAGAQPVAAIAGHLGISEVATRRHLVNLLEEGLIEEREQRASGGRPAAWFDLTERAGRLFPQSYDRFANEVLDFLTAQHGRDGLLAFLRWRVDREVDALADAVADGTVQDRVARLAEALTSAGFLADVVETAAATTGPDATTLPTLQLIQRHCAIEEVAREHPEICAYEAAAFSRALGADVQLSRRTTIAAGDDACVCTVTPRAQAASGNDTDAVAGRVSA
jgi:predicted ArsR family transcriptional regulator